MPKILLFCFSLVMWTTLFFCPSPLYANNLSVSNVSLTAPSASSGTVQVQFDIRWENAWRNATNRDAVWLIIKYSADSGTTWNHATLKQLGSSTGSGTAVTISIPPDLKGAFIERAETGSGTVDVASARLVWDYAADGLSASSSVRAKVFGVEMVYVSSGSFSAGDGASSAAFRQGSADTDPWTISGAGAISVTNATANSHYYTGAGNSGEASTGASFTIPAAFPEGFSAFYLMKYEITEGQWTDFFNTLTATQKIGRDISGADGKNSDDVASRNTLSWNSGDAETLRGDRACGFLSWMDVCAFADWAGLRPVTELEFEKAARGPNAAIAGEYAWGGTTAVTASAISGSEDGTETISTDEANLNHDSTAFTGGDGSSGPLRAGIFATHSTTRASAGAAYYGATELSGNLNEWTVTVGNAAGRGFSGTHGDGILSSIASYGGNATNADWPGIDGTAARGVTGANGAGVRGGSFTSPAGTLTKVSDRAKAVNGDLGRNADFGGRCARTSAS